MRLWGYYKANQWGIADVDALLDSLDSTQITEWMAFDETQHNAEDYRTARICLTIAQSMGGNSNLNLKDFLPRKGNVQQSDQEIQARFAAFREAK